jgi:glycosyltransferase involved in cell wall biosynthesis
VFTTCALDPATWANHYPPGTLDIAGVTVHRFASQWGRHPDFDRHSNAFFSRSKPSTAEQLEWLHLQGPICPDALDAAEESTADLVAFYPYLYHPTVAGVPRVAERAILHPAAHDERPIHLPVFRKVFEDARGMVFHTEGERRLVERLFPATVTRPQVVLGLGTDVGAGEPDPARAAIGGPLAAGRPFLLCVGRVDRGKGTDLLARYFATYKQRRPGPLALVFAGPLVHQPEPVHPDIVVAGTVDEATKWGLLRGAEVFVSPSGWESFSFVVLEAWSAGTPVLVNGRCEATRDHCEASGGGVWFEDYPTFEAALDRLLAERGLAGAMAAAGRAYVDEHFRWDVVVDRYRAFTAQLLAGG